jgi:hypothetical protein
LIGSTVTALILVVIPQRDCVANDQMLDETVTGVHLFYTYNENQRIRFL